jgi:hypothetical protein
MIGGTDDPEYLRQVLKTAKKLGDKNYIDRILEKMKKLGINPDESTSVKNKVESVSSSDVPIYVAVELLPKQQVNVQQPIKQQPVEKVVQEQVEKVVQEQVEKVVKQQYKLNENDKKVVKDYYDLKSQILSNIELLRNLKQKKDELMGIKSNIPKLIYSSSVSDQKSALDDCIRDESGKVTIC